MKQVKVFVRNIRLIALTCLVKKCDYENLATCRNIADKNFII